MPKWLLSVGLCSWDHLSDRWSWRHAMIWSWSWSRHQCHLVNKINVFYQAVAVGHLLLKLQQYAHNCKTAPFPSLTSCGRDHECNLTSDVAWLALSVCQAAKFSEDIVNHSLAFARGWFFSKAVLPWILTLSRRPNFFFSAPRGWISGC